jgi:hypothetical protein
MGWDEIDCFLAYTTFGVRFGVLGRIRCERLAMIMTYDYHNNHDEY